MKSNSSMMRIRSDTARVLRRIAAIRKWPLTTTMDEAAKCLEAREKRLEKQAAGS